jgi:kynurenine formamidase
MPGEPAPISRAEIEAMFDRLSNWGRWGEGDERGALNLMGDAARRRAASLVHDGIAVSASLPLATRPAPNNPSPVAHHMLRAGDIEGAFASLDYIGLAPHGRSNTHLDALCHIFHRGQLYNGRPASRVTSTGALASDITTGAHGIVGRGVLLDVPRALGRRWLEAGEAIYVEDLERAEAMGGLSVEEGDILLVRTGRHHPGGPPEGGMADPLAGLHATCLPWLREHGVAVLGGDGVSDVSPSGLEGGGLPVHTVAIVAMGVHLIDNCYLEDLSETCGRLGRWQFQLVVAPLRLPGGTSSPVNPIALF